MQLFPVSLIGLVVVILMAGCATKAPPGSAEIRQQGLTNVILPPAWKAGGQTGGITDNWLAAFDDQILDQLVREASSRRVPTRTTMLEVMASRSPAA